MKSYAKVASVAVREAWRKQAGSVVEFLAVIMQDKAASEGKERAALAARLRTPGSS